MTELIEKDIENLIYEIRGKQVMLSMDVAKLYKVETKVLNQMIKRNINRFPTSFCFQITKEELIQISSRSQIVTLNNNKNKRGLNIKYLPYALTEQGVMMLSGLLKSEIAVNINIQIINAFVNMRKYISNNIIEQKYINNMVLEDRERINILEETLNKFKEKNNHIFFEGQIYDAYSLLIDILNKSKKEIIIIDNYIDKNILDILSKINKKILIVTNKYNNEDYDKYQKQYKNITLKINNNYHDRFIILDRQILYHCGSSFKDLGRKCFEISKIEDQEILDKILKKI